jgi:L,D-transpeptidase catalytic domain
MKLAGPLGCVLLSIVAACIPAGSATAQIVARESLQQAALALRPGQHLWRDDPALPGPVSVVVSLPEQAAFVFRGETLIGMASVSTGKVGKRTPTGAFSILQKKVFHRSNLYSNAPMPYMQRLTWTGIALHAGDNPGYPASHGCIRLPRAFAMLLYGVTALGAPVAVVNDEWSLTPSDQPPPVLVADTGVFGGAHYAQVTFTPAPMPIGRLPVMQPAVALRIGDGGWMPDARLWLPSTR